MIDYSYFKKLTPRQQLNDLVHKYAQETGGTYGNSWIEFEHRWEIKYGSSLSRLIQKSGKHRTIPAYIEAIGKLPEALEIGHEMTGGKLNGR